MNFNKNQIDCIFIHFILCSHRSEYYSNVSQQSKAPLIYLLGTRTMSFSSSALSPFSITLRYSTAALRFERVSY